MKVLILIIALLFPGVAFAQIAFPGGWTVGYETIPADTDPISDGANDIRVMKDAVSERLEVDHCFGAGGGCGIEDTGLHKAGSANLLMSADCDAVAIGNHEDGYLCYDTVLYSLWVYDATAVAWVAVNAVAPGTVVLFDHATVCPDGYTRYAALDGLTLRGPDIAAADPNIPDTANVDCTGGGGAGGCGPGAVPGRYDDTITETQMPAHDHPLHLAKAVVSAVDFFIQATLTGGVAWEADVTSIEDTGGDDDHYHPFRTVLFCEKD